MGAYILRRILISIPVLIGITIIGFIALKLTPGDPLLTSVNPEALANMMAHPEVLESERRRLGFDQPVFPHQYVRWLANVLQGDLGYSISSHRSIVSEISSRLPQTLLLMVISLTMAILIGIPIGVITAVKQYSKLDYGLNAAAILLASTPVFVLSLIAIYVFAVNLHWLPTGQIHTVGRTDALDLAWHLILPASVLAIINAAPLVRYTRASMLEVLNADYVTTARAKGLGHQHGDHAPRISERADPDHHDRRPADPRGGRRRRHHRADLRLERDGPARGQGGRRARSVDDDGHHPDHGDRRADRQHHRRHRLRRRRSTSRV